MRRLTSSGVLRGALSALVGWALVPASAHAQGVSFGVHGGVAVPVGSFSSLVDPGPTVGAQIGFPVGSRVALSLDGDVDLLRGASLTSSSAPDVKLWRYGAGLEAGILQSPASRWSLVAGVGVGATRFDTDDFTVPGASSPTNITSTYLTTNSTLRLEYTLGSRFSGHFGGGAQWTKTDEADMAVLRSLDPSRVESIDSAWRVPVSVGVKVRTGRSPAPVVAAAPAARPAATPAATPASAPPASDERRVAALAILQERVHFDFDRYDIKPEFARLLDQKAEVLREFPEFRILIEGHCDELGSAEYNLALGQRRAQTVKDHLMRQGVAEARMQTTSFGKERPLMNQSNDQAWSMNRRAEFVVDQAR